MSRHAETNVPAVLSSPRDSAAPAAAAEAYPRKRRTELTEVSRCVGSDVFRRWGIRHVRVLSHSMLDSLIEKEVDFRLREALARRGSDLDDVELASDFENDRAEVLALAHDLVGKWSSFRAERTRKLSELKERLLQLRQKFQEIETETQRIAERIPVPGNGRPAIAAADVARALRPAPWHEPAPAPRPSSTRRRVAEMESRPVVVPAAARNGAPLEPDSGELPDLIAILDDDPIFRIDSSASNATSAPRATAVASPAGSPAGAQPGEVWWPGKIPGKLTRPASAPVEHGSAIESGADILARVRARQRRD